MGKAEQRQAKISFEGGRRKGGAAALQSEQEGRSQARENNKGQAGGCSTAKKNGDLDERRDGDLEGKGNSDSEGYRNNCAGTLEGEDLTSEISQDAGKATQVSDAMEEEKDDESWQEEWWTPPAEVEMSAKTLESFGYGGNTR
ncbi:hypothetical protein NDU88_004322 [Pleurodeles waltl]|uniref:Uncharacterized protein n=1 Tax=Pleurodeles waltl TaxID=8319 RepID=A0AAV7W8R5_PLEWA|nr:hypothetical protein NDU88_004322 [Pleurodeles waltl]